MMIWSVLAIVLLLAARLWGTEALGGYLSPDAVQAVARGLTVALVVAGTLFIDGFIRHFYWHRYWRRRRGRETPALIRDLLTIALVVLGLSIGLWWQEGLSFTGLITASGATAVILGIALQTVIQDLFSGLSINLDGSYALGDWLTIYSDQLSEPVYGCVTGVTWRSTFLTLEDGRRFMVPNHIVTSNPVVNHSRPYEPKRLEIEVGVDIRVPCDHAMEMLLGEALKAARGQGMASTPDPSVVVDHIDSDAIYYRVRFYAFPDKIMPSTAKSIMYCALLKVVQQSGLPLPVSQIELSQPPDLDFELEAEEMVAGLRHVSLFNRVLNDEQIGLLAQRCSVCEFGRGTVLMEQGAAASSMFIIIEGASRVTVTLAQDTPQEVAVLAAGDVVGEMSLLTGAPRSATVTALTRVRTLEITKEDIAELLQKSPELLERFSALLARRQQEQNQLANRASSSRAETDLLTRMRIFFGRVLG